MDHALATTSASFGTSDKGLEIHCRDCDTASKIPWDEVRDLSVWLILRLQERAAK